MKYRACLDTNVLFSGFFFAGTPSKLIERVKNGSLDAVIPQYVHDELFIVLNRHQHSTASAERFFALSSVRSVPDGDYLTRESHARAKALTRDPKDAPVLAFALHALAHNWIDFLVTGDKDLLTPLVEKAAKNRVLTPRAFLDKLNEPL